ncbi:hypothetical protein ACFCZ6_14565 [Streptomyces hydrogenans]|uniref:hypothetical protein n=1 Tax=Streptomyces hydrogenans TaxID=1873719 RepID=UPI0035E09914
MPRCEVVVSQTETISFSIEAASAEAAEERHLMDGVETGSATTSHSVESVAQER